MTWCTVLIEPDFTAQDKVSESALQVGSIFELLNQNPIFGVVGPDSPLYTPILGLFSVTGLPTAGAN